MTSILSICTIMGQVLPHLPKTSAVEHRRGQAIYTGARPSNRVYFLLTGQVAVSRLGSQLSPVVVGIYQTHEIFGEGTLVNQTSEVEEAIALEDSMVMSWPASEVSHAILQQPQLGMAMVKYLVDRQRELRWRMESFATDRILGRVARTLIHLSDRLGTPEVDGWVRMIPLTHKLISHYVGGTREIVTHHMSEFRKMGCVQYSRNGIRVNRVALEAWLNNSAAMEEAAQLPPDAMFHAA